MESSPYFMAMSKDEMEATHKKGVNKNWENLDGMLLQTSQEGMDKLDEDKAKSDAWSQAADASAMTEKLL